MPLPIGLVVSVEAVVGETWAETFAGDTIQDPVIAINNVVVAQLEVNERLPKEASS
jgi:hypothetical protein